MEFSLGFTSRFLHGINHFFMPAMDNHKTDLNFLRFGVMVFLQQREAVGDSASVAEIMNLDNNKMPWLQRAILGRLG